VLAVCRAAYDRWSARADTDLTVYLDAALTALAAGFAADKIKAGMPKADYGLTWALFDLRKPWIAFT
jgi:MftR C-terminal domain